MSEKGRIARTLVEADLLDDRYATTQRGLKSRHVQMMALGGTIGTGGLFTAVPPTEVIANKRNNQAYLSHRDSHSPLVVLHHCCWDTLSFQQWCMDW